MKCRYCGKEIRENANFCAFCGKKVDGEAETAKENEPEATEPEETAAEETVAEAAVKEPEATESEETATEEAVVEAAVKEPEATEPEETVVEAAVKEPEATESEKPETGTVTVKLEPSEAVTVGLEYTEKDTEGPITGTTSGYGNDSTPPAGGTNGSKKKTIITLCSLIAVLFVITIVLISKIVTSLTVTTDTSVQAEEDASVVENEDEEETREEAEATETSEESGESQDDEGVQSVFAMNQGGVEDHNVVRSNGSGNAEDSDGFSGGAVSIEASDGEDSGSKVLEEGIHKYEVIIADVSWSEAFQRCIDRGGHLVCFNSPEEYNYVLGLIDDMNIDSNRYNLFIGGRRGEGDDYFWVDESGQCVGEGLTENCKNYWLPGEPSLHDDSVNVDEYCMDMLYKKKDGRWYWNDVTDDPIGLSDYFSGRMGYICEYQ